MTSEYTKPTIMDYIVPKRWRKKNNIVIPDELKDVLETHCVINNVLAYMIGTGITYIAMT